MADLNETSWSPERKIVGGAFAVLVLGVIQVVTGVDVAPGVEGALGIVVAYFLPNER